MKLPEKTIPFLVLLLLVVAFLLGRYQGQLELLKGDKTQKQEAAQTGNQGNVVGQQAQPTMTQVNLPEEKWKQITEGAAAVNGVESAPVTIVEFSDYQCPYCSRYVDEAYSEIKEKYIANGKVRYMFRDFPLPFHQNAMISALAARCAGDQGKYWEMHDILYEKQSDWSGSDAKDKFVGYASDIGINSEAFTKCLDDEKYKDAIEADLALVQELGVGGTPGFFVNGKLMVGALPFSEFEKAIEAEL